jgi:hypothetical protein
VDWCISLCLPPEEYHERRTFCRRGSNPRPCDRESAFES